MSEERFRGEVGRTQRVLGRDGRMCLRPPYGAVDQTVRGLSLALDRLESGDWRYQHTC